MEPLSAARLNQHIGVLGDLCGPKIRVGRQPAAGTELVAGTRVAFIPEFADEAAANRELGGLLCLKVAFHDFIFEAGAGHRILLDDGTMELRALEQRPLGEGSALVCEVVLGGLLKSNKGINFPDTELTVPALTDHDYRCVDFAVEHGFDFLGKHLHSADVEDAFGPAPEIDPTGGIAFGQVAGREPAVAFHLGRRLPRRKIGVEHPGTAQP